MPSPASDAIASDVGHGSPGVRSNLRPFRDLLSETAGQRHLWVEMRPKKVFASWTAAAGGVYTKAITETFDGVALDIVSVQTLSETLLRTERSSAVVAGSFYYDGTTLSIHLTADANPSGTTVVALLGVHIGSHGVHQPLFMVDRLTNGSLEAWTGTTPDGWTKTESAGSVTIDKTASDPLEGGFAARVTFASSAAAVNARIEQQFSTAVNKGLMYRYSGAYRITSATNLLRVELQILNDFDGNEVSSDGRTVVTPGSPFLTDVDGSGIWKRFAFDFVCPTGVKVRAQAVVVSGTQSGTVDFDDLKLQPISRFAYYEPLLAAGSLPTIEAARADSFWGAMSSALGSLSILNGNGRFEPLLAAYDWLGADCIVRVGGKFQLGGNETFLEDCPVIASGKLGAPTVTDSGVAFDLQDDRKLLSQTLPTRTYNNNGGTDAYNQPDRGRVRPLLFGSKEGMRPVQYDVNTPYSGAPVPQGIYELVDCDDWPTGIYLFDNFDWYADETAAQARNATLRNRVPGIAPQSNGITQVLTTGRFTMLRDQRPVIITSDNNKLVFDIGGGSFTVTLPVGTYTMYDHRGANDVGLLATLGTGMRAVSGAGDITVTFTDTAQKVRIAKNAGTLNLRCATGADVQTSLWDVLGFEAATDKTGALSYDADNVFTSPAQSQTIRISATGFKDDGTYTGSSGLPIEKAPDIALFLLRVILGVPASSIDTASFVAARAVATRPCSLYIGESRTVADVFAELETSGNMDLILSGGIWRCVTRDTSVPAGTPDLVDADILEFSSAYSPDDLFGTVRLTYNDSPDNPEPGANFDWSPHARTAMGEVTDASIALRFARPDQRTFKTCLRDAADATTNPARLQEIATQCSTKRRRFTFKTKGKALQVPVGGKIRLTRAKGLDTTGALLQVLVRVLSKRDDWARWTSDITAIEVV
jgi:hypothetical protein